MYLLQQCRAKTKQRAHGIFVEVYVVLILKVDMRLIDTADANQNINGTYWNPCHR